MFQTWSCYPLNVHLSGTDNLCYHVDRYLYTCLHTDCYLSVGLLTTVSAPVVNSSSPATLFTAQPGEPHIRVKGCVCEGKSFTLTCESDGMNPPVDLTWYRGRQVVTNATVSHSRHNPALVKSRIRIGPAGRSDHGAVYRCVATNKRYPDARAERRMILKVQREYAVESFTYVITLIPHV